MMPGWNLDRNDDTYGWFYIPVHEVAPIEPTLDIQGHWSLDETGLQIFVPHLLFYRGGATMLAPTMPRDSGAANAVKRGPLYGQRSEKP